MSADPTTGTTRSSRGQRATIADETVRISEAGRYTAPGGAPVDLRRAVQESVAGTQYHLPEALTALCERLVRGPAPWTETHLTLRNETTLAAAASLVDDGDHRHVGALNFASAMNPGGGFLNGSQAQEESLARSSGLYSALRTVPQFYDAHRQDPSRLYSDRMISTPRCPVFRDDTGGLLERPYLVTILTSAAPNAGAIASNRPHEAPLVEETLRRRAELVLALAAHLEIDALVLGAWGCGVFRNDPALVAQVFVDLLRPGAKWHGRFLRVHFAVLDHATPPVTYEAFAEALPV